MPDVLLMQVHMATKSIDTILLNSSSLCRCTEKEEKWLPRKTGYVEHIFPLFLIWNPVLYWVVALGIEIEKYRKILI